MSLYNKYRPQSLSEIKGNKEVVSILEKMLEDKKTMPHSFLLHGESGTGKTSIARIIAKELECTSDNLIEIDAGQFRGIDTIRGIRENINYAPLDGSVRIYIIDETHSLTGDSSNALLKILEDVPSHAFFILATTDPQKLLPTIRSRCIQLKTEPLSDDVMFELLDEVSVKEGTTLPEDVLEKIIENSFGLARGALTVLEKVLNATPEDRLRVASQSALEKSEGVALCRALMKGESWKKVSSILKGLKGQDAESVRRIALGYASAVLLNRDDFTAFTILECFEEPLYNIGFPGLVLACYRVLNYN